MALELKATSGWWYAKIRVKDQLRLINLDIPIEGIRPLKLTALGDEVFERSRGKAMAKHDEVVADIRKKGNLEELSQRIVEIKTGYRVETVALKDLFEAWEGLPHESRLGKPYVSFCKGIIRRFTEYMGLKFPQVTDMAGVTRNMMAGFLKAEENRNISARTWTATMILIRGLFKHLQPDADAYRRYLVTLRGKSSATVHREPFTAVELQAIITAAKDDELIYPLIVVACSTAMRRGDCCLLKWKSVDLKAGFIIVKTGKTGETVEMPIFPMLRTVLEGLTRAGDYVFPVAADIYQKRPDALNNRLQKILTKVGFVRPEIKESEAEHAKWIALPMEETRAKALAAIDKIPGTEGKRVAMRQTLELYMSGKTFGQVAAGLDVSKGTVSGHLNVIEKLIQAPILQAHRNEAMVLQVRGPLRSQTEAPRIRSANVRGWHSFRTTWITLALSAGLPMELVRRVSGHTTADVVLKHYFRPGREDFRQAIMKAMPSMLTAADVKEPSAVSEPENGNSLARALEALDASTTAEDREKQRDLVIKLVRSAKDGRELGPAKVSAA